MTWVNDLRDESGQLLSAHPLPVDTCVHGPDLWGSEPRLVMHLHGGLTRPEFDGHPDYAQRPGQQRVFEYEVLPVRARSMLMAPACQNTQRGSTLWYHDHGLGVSRLSSAMGLAGFYLISDAGVMPLGVCES